MMTVVENNCFSNFGSLITVLATKNKSIPILPAVTLLLLSKDGQCTKRRRNIARNFKGLSRVHERYRHRRQTEFAKKEKEIFAAVCGF